MRDHNSLTGTMGEAYASFLMDLENLTTFTFDRERLRVRRILRTSGCPGFLQFLDKHHQVLLEWLRTEKLDATSVSHDSAGVPLFLHSLWSGLATEPATCVPHLRQAMCLFRKWAESSVDSSDDIEKFEDRMRCQNQHSYSTIDAIAEHLPAVLGNEDLQEDDPVWVKVTSGARARKTPILRRIDEICESPLRLRHALDGFTIVPKNKTNRLVCVPKDWSKNRLVFAEPSPSMNLQQVLRMWMEERVVQTKSHRISWDDQTAQHRSMLIGRRATIDLSDASDHVSAALIWRFFVKYPRLRSALFWARSARTNVGDTDIVLRCFGTMGNATTFTVMSIFLACLTRAAEKHCDDYTGLKSRRSTVFGDDIVCDDYVAATVLSMLQDVGLRPNKRKTYISMRFRETCGLDIFDGEDVTPVYIKHVRVHCKDDVLRCVKQSNTLHMKGYWQLARTIADLTGRNLSVNVDEASLISFCKGADYTSCKWNRCLQRYESSYTLRRRKRVKNRDSHLDLQYALFHGCRIQDAT